jgi:hypothetical protein
VAFLGIVGLANDAQATDFTEFQAARQVYEDGNYEGAVEAFEDLVGGAVPRITDAFIIQESRKYLGAAYIFVDREEDAEEQFERIVRQDEHQRMQASTFTQDVVTVFDRVRARVRRELAEEREAEAERERRARDRDIARLRAEQEQLERLVDFAATNEVREENSRFVAVLPFGAGQFQNRNPGLGYVFLVSEAVLLAGSILAFGVHTSLDPADYDVEDRRVAAAAFEEDERAWRITYWASTGAFILTALIGIIEAQLNFVPYRSKTERRDVPEDLLPEPIAPEVDVSLGPTGASLRVTF